MSQISISLNGVAKDFNRRPVFWDISFQLSSSSSLAITGKNGAGKSTLSKIIAGLLNSTRGSVEYKADGSKIDVEKFKHHIGFVSPYLNYYDEFTALENLELLSRIRISDELKNSKQNEMLKLVGLWSRRNDLVGTFSSGMKQRLKYAFALLHQPEVLILDEPTSNLDAEGIELVNSFIKIQKKEGILIIATNDKEESSWCDQRINVGMSI